MSFTIGLAFFAAISRSASAGASDIFVGVAFGWGAMLLFVGPLWMRFDLRLDLQRLEIVVPSLARQAAIVAFAEEATREKRLLSALIENRQQQMNAKAFSL